MPVQSNATTEDELALVKAYNKSLSKAERKQDWSVQFDKRHVVVLADDAAIKLTRKQFSTWAEQGFPVMAAEPLPPARTVATPAAPAATSNALDALATEAFGVAMEEREGDHGRNAARFRRGELMLRLEGIASANRSTIKNALVELNRRLVSMAGDHMVPDINPISDQEASTTKRVVEAFGSSGEFDLVDAVNPNTGDPLVNDAGEPPKVALTDVAMNKLYPLAEFAGEVDQDRLLSFAHRNTEKVVKKAKAVAKNASIPIKTIITKLNKAREEGQHVITGDPVKVQLKEKEAMAFLRNLAGEAPAPEVATIKTSRAWFDATWTPLKDLAAAVMKRYHPEMVNPASGEVSNVFVLERTLTQFFNVHEDKGVESVLGALVAADDITTAQAESFIEDFAFDTERGTWVLRDPSSEAYYEARAEGGDLDPDDDLFGDEEVADEAFDPEDAAFE